MIETKNVLATKDTTSFALVITCKAGENQMDDLVDFFEEQGLAYAEMSDEFKWSGSAYLDIFSTADSRECQYDALLPISHTTEALAIKYAQSMINESAVVSKRFFTIVVCDADQIDETLKNAPFKPGEWI
jgi:hypothetical protein